MQPLPERSRSRLPRDWRRLLVVEQADVQDWQADLALQQQRFWEEGWQALPAPPAPTTPKLIPVMTTGHGMEAVELAHTYFRRWNCQENAIRDWLIPRESRHQSRLRQRAGRELGTGQTSRSVARA